MTWTAFAEQCRAQLETAGIDRPARLVADWFYDVFGRASRFGSEPVPVQSQQLALQQLQQLLRGEPLAYVTGIAHFYGYELVVGPGALIPRPETEELVRWILEAHPQSTTLRFADLCTGSGCIAIALQLKRLTWQGVGLDVSPFALTYANENLRKHDLQHLLSFRQDDVLAEHSRSDLGDFDLIVSNPPYIPASDWHRVDASVADHEPHLALAVGSDAPLLFYERLEVLAQRLLRPLGWLYVECNDRYAQDVAHLYSARGWAGVEVFVDMQRKERHVRAQLATDGRKPD